MKLVWGIEDIRAVLAKCEWRGSARHEGQIAAAPDNGLRYPCCPICGGIKPGKFTLQLFLPEVIGHQPHCELVAILGVPHGRLSASVIERSKRERRERWAAAMAAGRKTEASRETRKRNHGERDSVPPLLRKRRS